MVTHEHPGDPFRPQVKILRDAHGVAVEEPFLVNTWEAEARPRGVAEAVDPDDVQVDPLAYL